jgi:hypothetical protein
MLESSHEATTKQCISWLASLLMNCTKVTWKQHTPAGGSQYAEDALPSECPQASMRPPHCPGAQEANASSLRHSRPDIAAPPLAREVAD